MRWQRQEPSLRKSLEEAEQTWRDNQRMERDLEVLLSEKPIEINIRSHFHNRRPYRDPSAQPVKWMKLVQWWLLHRVPIDEIITPEIEASACRRFKIPEWKWKEAKKRFPNLLLKVMKRKAFFFQTSQISASCGRFGWKKNADLRRLGWPGHFDH
jgi:hypothetical protein